MTVQLGAAPISSAYFGAAPLSAIYVGATQLWPAGFDPEAGLTLTTTLSAGPQDATIDPFASQDTVFATTTSIPTTAGGVLLEHGGSGRGLILCMKTATSLRLRAGDGASPFNANDTVVLDADVSAFQDGQPRRLVWDVRPQGVARVRLWIGGALQGEALTANNTALENNQWSGGGSGGFVTGDNANVSGEPNDPWAGTMGAGAAGQLSIYANQQVSAT